MGWLEDFRLLVDSESDHSLLGGSCFSTGGVVEEGDGFCSVAVVDHRFDHPVSGPGVIELGADLALIGDGWAWLVGISGGGSGVGELVAAACAEAEGDGGLGEG